MNTKNACLASCAVLLLLAMGARAQEPASTPGAAREIKMTAKKYEFDPSTITVK